MPKYKPGDMCVYRGASQAGILATGDLVEVELYDAFAGVYRIKYPMLHANYTFTAHEHELFLDKEFSLDWSHTSTYTVITDEEKERRRELGLCLKCGAKRRMSWHGLLDCASCAPP